MSAIWIVHRDPQIRAALARLAASPEDAVRAAPGDPLLDAAAAPEVVLLGVSGDFEAELQFAHRFAARIPEARWVLIAEAADLHEARRLFDTLDAEVLAYPPDPQLLRRGMQRARSEPLALSQRPARDELRDRFTRWFADLDLPELLRAIDPRLADVPLLILGEPGTGRALLGRYAHAFGGTASGLLAHLPCGPDTTAADAAATIAAVSALPRGRAACAVLLEDADRLDPAVQRELAGWIEFGPPEGAASTGLLRWIGTASGALEPRLGRALSGLCLRLPPLRERRRAIAPFANDAARRWSTRRGLPARRMGEDAVLVLEEYPWPGNLRELEAVVEETLAAGAADPVGAGDLRHDGEPLVPLEVGAPEARIEEALAREDFAEMEIPSLVLDPPGVEVPGLGEPPPVPDLDTWPSPDSEPAPAREAGPPTEPDAGPLEAPDPAERKAFPPLELVEEAEESTAEDPREALHRLARALAHEVRNPLTSIRSFAALLPERYGDPEFRERFAEHVGDDVERIRDVVERVERLASLEPPQRVPVDVAGLLDELLRERRDAIRRRRLLVLKELDTDQPSAMGDPDQLRFAFAAVLDKSLELVPERGDLYCASRHHPGSELGRGGASLRVLLRFQGSESDDVPPAIEGAAPAENSLGLVVADAVIRAQGGTLTVDAGEAETVIVIDLPAPDPTA